MTLRDAQQIAHGLIQGYIGPDHKVIDMKAQALEAAHATELGLMGWFARKRRNRGSF